MLGLACLLPHQGNFSRKSKNFKVSFQRISVFSFDTLYLILMYIQVPDLDSDDYFLVKVNRIPSGTMPVAAISICQVLQILLNSEELRELEVADGWVGKFWVS